MWDVLLARETAAKAHADVNHRYDGKPYLIHLDMAYEIGERFSYLIKPEAETDVLSAVYLHDIIEDCRWTYNDVLERTNKRVAELVYAVTDQKGRNRNERHNGDYYNGIVNTEYATFVKLCDLCANALYSKGKGMDSKFYQMYQSEFDKVVAFLYEERYKDFFAYYAEILNKTL